MAPASRTTVAKRRRTRKDAPRDPLNPLLPAPVSPFVEAEHPAPPRPLVAEMQLAGEVWVFDLSPAPPKLGDPLPIALSLGTMAWPTEKRDAPAELAKDEAGKPGIVPGLSTEDMREFFLHGTDMAGVLSLRRRADGWTATLGKTSLPYVLTKDAVQAGVMPPEGQSGLPPSLERVVPVRLRYWQYKGAEAEALRNALVETAMFEDRLVKVVNGELRLCVEQLFLYEPDDSDLGKSEFACPIEPVNEPPYAFVCETCDAAVTKATRALAGDKVELRFSCDPCAKRLADTPGVVVLKDMTVEDALAQNPSSLVGKTVEVEGLDGARFEGVVVAEAEGNLVVDVRADDVTTRVLVARDRASLVKFARPVPPRTRITLRGPAALDAESDDGAQIAKTVAGLGVRILAQKADSPDDAEERIVYGIVLEPETVDAQQDVYSPQEIRNAAHVFMQQYRTVGLMHKGGVNDKVKILESFIAPGNFEVNGQPVKAGTWVMACKVLDDELWKACRDGDLTGFSIGGTALRKPDAEGTKPLDDKPKTEAA